MKLRFLSIVFIACINSLALADEYPSKPIQLLVPFAPGGTTDIVARVISEPLTKILGQSVLVVNRPGGGGVVGVF